MSDLPLAEPLSPANPQLRIRDDVLLERLSQFLGEVSDSQRLLWQAITINGAIPLGAVANQVNLSVTVHVKVVHQRLPLRVSPCNDCVEIGRGDLPSDRI